MSAAEEGDSCEKGEGATRAWRETGERRELSLRPRRNSIEEQQLLLLLMGTVT